VSAWSRWGITAYAGKCGTVHYNDGNAPPGFFRLDCDQCERDIFGLDKQDVVVITPGNVAKGIPAKIKMHQKPVAPGWSRTMAGCPLTDPERERQEETQDTRGHISIEALERLREAREVNLPPELVYLSEGRMP